MRKGLSRYSGSIDYLLKLINHSDSRYTSVLTLKARLYRIEESMQDFGETPAVQAEWAKIIHALNTIALETTGVGLDSLETRNAVLEPLSSKPTRRYPYPGLDSLGTEDQEIFFGRGQEINDLLVNIQQDSIIVVNGLSGSGKSSLIKAGIIPHLKQMGLVVLYTPVFEDIVEDLYKQMQYALGVTMLGEHWDDQLCRIYKEVQKPIVVIVDQFEQALSERHNPRSLESFLRGIPRLVSQVERFATIVIVVRADWLYYLESSVKQVYPRLNVHACIFTVDPLGKEAAREAIIRPLEQWGLPYDEGVVKEIVDNLHISSRELVIGSYIHPIQLQIVLRQLFLLADRRGNWREAISKEIYRDSGGVESILRNYLTDSVGRRSEAWRLLARFVSSDSSTGRTIRQSELFAVPAAEDVETELRFLVNQGLVEIYQQQDTEDTLYRLSHDYLVEAIESYLQQNVDHLGWKLAEDWLATGVLDWKESLKRSEDEGLLLEEGRYLHIYEYRDRLQIEDDAQHLLLLTALHYAHEGLGYWISRGNTTEQDIIVLIEHLLNADQKICYSACVALSKSLPRTQTDTPTIDEPSLDVIRQRLSFVFAKSPTREQRIKAAQALWIIQDFASIKEQYSIGKVVLGRWVMEHRNQIISYVLTVLFVLTLVFGVLYVNRKLRGTWVQVYSLKAGQVARVAVDPRDPEVIYALTVGGSEPREGLSLFVRRNEEWELVSRSFTQALPTEMIVVGDKEQTTIHLALHARGILSSNNLGQVWEPNNKGLSSRKFTDLVVNTQNEQVLYLSTADWHGVLRSEDGGQSWESYDHFGEIYGAVITSLGYTPANGGVLIAGTANGKILTHGEREESWSARYGLPKGAILSITVSPSDENVVYASTNQGVVIKSVDGGGTWAVLGQIENAFQTVGVYVHPNIPDKLYAVAYGSGGYKIWFSDSGGVTWTALPATGLPRSGIDDILISQTKPDTLVAGTGEGLFASQDGGLHWTKVDLPAPLASITAIALHPESFAPVYVGSRGSVYVNTSGNLCNWIRGQGLSAGALRTIVSDPLDPNRVYAGVFLLGEWSVFTSADGGQEWKQTNPPPIEPVASDTMALAVSKSSVGGSVLYAGTLGCGVFRSDNQGKSWETFNRTHCGDTSNGMPTDVYFLAIDAVDPHWIYAAAGQNVHYSSDGGSTWKRSRWISQEEPQSIPNNLNSTIIGFAADPITPRVAYLVTRSNGFWKSIDGGVSWKHFDTPWSEGMQPSVLSISPGKAGHLTVGAANGEVWQSLDGGYQWKTIRENLAVGFITSMVTNTELGGKIILGTAEDGIAVYIPGKVFNDTDYERAFKCSE